MNQDGESLQGRGLRLPNVRVGPGLIAALVAGLLVGLLIGWVLWPVRWVELSPPDLSAGWKKQYIAMVVDSFTLNKNLDLAKARLRGIPESDLAAVLDELAATYNQQGQPLQAQRVQDLKSSLGLRTTARAGPTGPAATAPATATAPRVPSRPASSDTVATLLSRAGTICGAFLIAIVLFAVVLALVRRALRGRGSAPAAATAADIRRADTQRIQVGRTATASFMGAERPYRSAFFVHDVRGQLLGECGLREADVQMAGNHRYVSSFEIWLFDKAANYTAALIVSSEQRARRDATVQRTESGARVISAERRRIEMVETSRLRLEAEIIDFDYVEGPNIDPATFFDRLTVDLTPLIREEAHVVGGPPPGA